MQLPQPTWLHVAIPVLPVGEMPAIEEGRACEAELHGGLHLACRIHAGVLDEGREVLTCGLKQGAVLGARYLRDDALLDRPRGGRGEFDVPVSVHFVAKDAHPPHEGVNVQLVAHALSAPVVGWQRRRRPGVRSEEHTSELQSQSNLVCRLLLEKKKNITQPPSSLSDVSP